MPWPLWVWALKSRLRSARGPAGALPPPPPCRLCFPIPACSRPFFSLLASRSEWGVFPPFRGYEIAGPGRGRPAGVGSHPLPLHVLWGVWGPAAPIPRASDGGGVPRHPPWGQAASRAIPGLLSGTWSEHGALVPVWPLQGQTPRGGWTGFPSRHLSGSVRGLLGKHSPLAVTRAPGDLSPAGISPPSKPAS